MLYGESESPCTSSAAPLISAGTSSNERLYGVSSASRAGIEPGVYRPSS